MPTGLLQAPSACALLWVGSPLRRQWGSTDHWAQLAVEGERHRSSPTGPAFGFHLCARPQAVVCTFFIYPSAYIWVPLLVPPPAGPSGHRISTG